MHSNSTIAINQPDRSSHENIGPGDARYENLVARNFNKRFAGTPDSFRLVSSTADVIDAVQFAVNNGLQLAARSGGHCLEDFVSNSSVRFVIDTSPMTSVSWDDGMGAFAIEPGTTLGEVYRKLCVGWNVVLPAGQSPDIGAGGHLLGSAFGFLHRKHGLAVDYLYAVELVYVNAEGKANSIIATREATDPNRELWWAHTGCGGGNFGIVTRYWFRSPDAVAGDAMNALPRAPKTVVTRKAEWDWEALSAPEFAALFRNYGRWCEQHADANSSTNTMFSVIIAPMKGQGKIALRAMSIADAGAQEQIDSHFAAIDSGVGKMQMEAPQTTSWLLFSGNPFPDLYAVNPGGTVASPAKAKMKDALFKTRHTDKQLQIMYDYLTRTVPNVGGSIGFATYGGRINAVAGDVTAAAQRSSIMDTSYSAGWMNDEGETGGVRFVREFYRDLFAETGGVPVPNEQTEGAMINHPDSDMASAEWNTSGVSFGTIYYGANYARLQQVKAKWDSRNVFRHALSIPLP